MQQGEHHEKNGTRGMRLENGQYCEDSVIGPARRMQQECNGNVSTEDQR